MPDQSTPYLLVVGSSNTDMVIKTPHLPAPGETILGGHFFMNPGGKGANQAVAAARLGAEVIFVCKTGNDIFGSQSLEIFRREKINTDYILSDADNPSGVALITVDDKGENSIAVASGANGALEADDLRQLKSIIENAAMVLMQLEIPLETVQYVATTASLKGVPVMLNPAPAIFLPDELLKTLSIITPNETEAAMLTGTDVSDRRSAEAAAIKLREKGAGTVIITLGPEGALALHNDEFIYVPGNPVEAVDTTAAGDIFNGALAVAMIRGMAMREAIAYAGKAAGISVTRMGAQASAPYHHEIV